MTARILVADHDIRNIRQLEARLAEEYFDVVSAVTVDEAFQACVRGQCDAILLGHSPEMDSFELCRQIKGNPQTSYIPIVMITARDRSADRVKGLEAGADDFLIKPINDVALITRVRSLIRLKTLTDELMMRAATTADGALDDPFDTSRVENVPGKIILVDDAEKSVREIEEILSAHHSVRVEPQFQDALFAAAEGDYDVAIVSLDLVGIDGLKFCAQVRSLDRTRLLPILVIAGPDDNRRILRGLDLGVNDFVVRPIDKDELIARAKTQVRRKRFADRLRDSMQMSMERGITDSVTGLHNGGYFERHIVTLVDQAKTRRKPLSLLIIDVDNLKIVNDTHGHLAGAEVLKELGRRLRKAFRGIDLVVRWGGDEFVAAMPDTEADLALLVAERVRQKVADEPFSIRGGTLNVHVTVSIGVSSLRVEDSAPKMFERADAALYRAKGGGRNRVATSHGT